MTLGSWEPPSNNTAIDTEKLEVFANANLDNLTEDLTASDIQSYGYLMQLGTEAWRPVANNLDDQMCLDLIRFFTVAEEVLTGWEAGADSPVIALNKELRSRGKPLTKDMLVWIRNHSKNRYLPNGPIMGL